MQKDITVGIDLAGKTTNPTGWALLKNKQIQTYHLYTTKEILAHTFNCSATLAAIDAPLALPKKNAMREADRQMHKLGYPVFPPRFQAMRILTLRAIRITKEQKEKKDPRNRGASRINPQNPRNSNQRLETHPRNLPKNRIQWRYRKAHINTT